MESSFNWKITEIFRGWKRKNGGKLTATDTMGQRTGDIGLETGRRVEEDVLHKVEIDKTWKWMDFNGEDVIINIK